MKLLRNKCSVLAVPTHVTFNVRVH